jgi:uncharacterized damage-inducible protein DinB
VHTYYEDYLARLAELHDDLARSAAGLPPAALDWTPGVDMNSIAVLMVHVAGAERYWLGDVVAREPSGRQREAEFQTRNLSAAALAEPLFASLAYARRVLAGLSLQDLEAARVSPRDGRQTTVGWALAHVLVHTATHLGHVEITRQLWEQSV